MTAEEALSLIKSEYLCANSGKPTAIVIAGPTASGKTSLAIEVARALGGEIISCDSMQIYKFMDIGTAKPTFEERSLAVHHMIDFLYPWEEFSAAEFCEKARDTMKDIVSRGKVPVLCGGTGLYISSLLENIEFSETDEKEEEIRRFYEEKASAEGIESVYSILKEYDPKAAEAIHVNNAKRVIRALVLYKTTGKTQSERNILSKQSENEFDYLTYILNPDRDELYARIEKRVDIMIADGLEQEILYVMQKCREAYENGLCASPLPGKTAYQAIGYKEFSEYFEGKISLDDAAAAVKLSSRRYAKRQLTWFRRIENARWIDMEY